jgi:hypothetical protein
MANHLSSNSNSSSSSTKHRLQHNNRSSQDRTAVLWTRGGHLVGLVAVATLVQGTTNPPCWKVSRSSKKRQTSYSCSPPPPPSLSLASSFLLNFSFCVASVWLDAWSDAALPPALGPSPRLCRVSYCCVSDRSCPSRTRLLHVLPRLRTGNQLFADSSQGKCSGVRGPGPGAGLHSSAVPPPLSLSHTLSWAGCLAEVRVVSDA